MDIRRCSGTRGLALTLSLLVALLPFSPGAAFAEGAVGSVETLVVAAASGEPLAGVTVAVVDMATAEILAEEVTTEEGVAAFTDLPFGLYTVILEGPEGFAGATGPLIFLNRDNPSVAVNIVLQGGEEDDEDRRRRWLPFLWLGLGGAATGFAISALVGDGTG